MLSLQVLKPLNARMVQIIHLLQTVPVMAQRCHENTTEKPNQQAAGKGGNGWQR